MAVKEKTSFAFPEMFDLDTGKTKMFTGIRATNSNIGLLLRTSVSEMFGVGKERIRQLKETALRRLKRKFSTQLKGLI